VWEGDLSKKKLGRKNMKKNEMEVKNKVKMTKLFNFRRSNVPSPEYLKGLLARSEQVFSI